MPCTECTRHGRTCRMAPKRPRCLECVRRGVKCDGLFVGLQIDRRLDQQRALRAQEESAEDELMKLQSEMAKVQARVSESLARLTRLRTQRRFLEKRTEELADQDTANLEFLDGVTEESSLVLDAQSMGAQVVDWSFLDAPGSPDPLPSS